MTHPYLRWIKIHRYQRFKDVEIEFSPDENLLLGMNGAGKTQLLRLLGAVIADDYARVKEQDFHIEFDIVYEAGSLRGLVKHARSESEFTQPDDLRRSASSIEATLQASTPVGSWHATVHDGAVTFSEPSLQSLSRVHYPTSPLLSALTALLELGDRRGTRPSPLVLDPCHVHEDDRDFRVLTQELAFDLDPRRNVKFTAGNFRFGRPLVLLALLASTALRSDGTIEELPLGDPRSQRFGVTDGIIRSVLAPLRAESIFLAPERLSESEGLIHCKGVRLKLHFRPGETIWDAGLTFGQRRYLIAALLAAISGNAPFLIDEPDNGLHPRLVEALIRSLEGRQRFFACHNKLVIDFTRFASPADVQQKIHIVKRDDAGNQSVERLDEATARNIFESIDVGIMHPADVLRAEGIW